MSCSSGTVVTAASDIPASAAVGAGVEAGFLFYDDTKEVQCGATENQCYEIEVIYLQAEGGEGNIFFIPILILYTNFASR